MAFGVVDEVRAVYYSESSGGDEGGGWRKKSPEDFSATNKNPAYGSCDHFPGGTPL